jgi:hypothetical protein
VAGDPAPERPTIFAWVPNTQRGGKVGKMNNPSDDQVVVSPVLELVLTLSDMLVKSIDPYFWGAS